MNWRHDLELFHAAVTEPEPPEALDWATDVVGLDAAGCVGVYRRAYRTRLVDTLRDVFPRVADLLGDDFDAVAGAWVQAHPPRVRSLLHLGADFPAVLAPGARDLALLDDARRRVFDAPDDRPLTASELAALPPEAWPGLALGRVRASAVIEVEHAVCDWETGQPLEPHAATVLVWRQGNTALVHHRPLSAIEATFVAGLDAGEVLAEVAERVAEAVPVEPLGPLTAALRRAVAEGWLLLRV